MLKKFIIYLLPMLLVISFVCGLVYITVQQNYRNGANDPQVQYVNDLSNALSDGTDINTLISSGNTDIAKSYDTFILVYDDSGQNTKSTALLDGQVPQVPSGVFDSARTKTQQDIFTWQPKTGVRLAAVIQHFSGKSSGFVLAARSLKIVEDRESSLLVDVIIAWVSGIFASICLTAVVLFLIQSDRLDKKLEKSKKKVK